MKRDTHWRRGSEKIQRGSKTDHTTNLGAFSLAQSIMAAEIIRGFSLNEDRFVTLLTKLVGESERLQNNPAQGLIPREDCASDHILELLSPYEKKNGGMLEVEVSLCVTFHCNCVPSDMPATKILS